MGAILTKKNDIETIYELKFDRKKQLPCQLLQLANWSFFEIKKLYSSYCSRTTCPFIDEFIFKKIMPNIGQNALKIIFNRFSRGQKYISIFELICILVLFSYNSYKQKLHLLFCIFDFRHEQKIRTRVLILIFQSLVLGFCRITSQQLPFYSYLSKYSFQRYIRTNQLEVLDKLVSFRAMLYQVQGNSDAVEMFQPYEREQTHQEPNIFEVKKYKKYTNSEINRLFRIILRGYSQQHYQQIQQEEENKKTRLNNRKQMCALKIIEDKKQLFKTIIDRNLQEKYISKMLPKLKSKSTLKDKALKLNFRSAINLSKKQNQMSKNKQQIMQKSSSIQKHQTKMVFLNGNCLSRHDIFKTIDYFKTLSNGDKNIRFKQFFQTFERKAFMKKQVSSLFLYFDKKKKGIVSFEDFLRASYPQIRYKDIHKINEWKQEYNQIYELDKMNPQEYKKLKKDTIELPNETLIRINQIFNSLDRNKKGYISFEDMKNGYSNGYTITEIQNIIKEKGGKIYPDVFIRMTLPTGWTIEGTTYVGD